MAVGPRARVAPSCQPEPGQAAPGGAPRWRLYVAIGAVILAAIFILQNSQEVTVDFLFASTTETPLIFALLLAAVLGLHDRPGCCRARRRQRHD